MKTPEEVLRDARSLPLEARTMPVDAIVADIHAIEPNVEASWHVEIDRRLEQLRSGETTPIPLAEFKDELMERLCLR